MTDESDFEMIGDVTSLTWSETWIKALTQPSVEAYEEIVNDPGASIKKGYTWIAISSVIGTLISNTLGFIFGSVGGDEGTFIFLIYAIALMPIFSIIGFTIIVGINQNIARIWGGTGSFSKLVYPYSAYSAPLTLVTSGLGTVPILSLLLIPLWVYGVFLSIIAIKVVNQFSWVKAVISSFAILIPTMIVVAAFIIIGIVLLAPAIGDVFSEILSNIQ